MKNLKENVIKQINERYQRELDTTENIEWVERWTLNKKTPYKGTIEERKAKILKAVENLKQKQISKKLKQIETVLASDDFFGELVVSVDWKRSAMWGSNPTAIDNFGHNSGSIGGCGYDKLSTAVASVLNQNNSLLKLMYTKKENEYKENIEHGADKSNELVFGYGSGYGPLPYFEGGVGLSCYYGIFKAIGLEMKHYSTKHSDTIIVKKAVQ